MSALKFRRDATYGHCVLSVDKRFWGTGVISRSVTLSARLDRRERFRLDSVHALTGGQKTFLDERDYQTFIDARGEVKQKTPFVVFAYCLTPNHFHLLILSPLSPSVTLLLQDLTMLPAAVQCALCYRFA